MSILTRFQRPVRGAIVVALAGLAIGIVGGCGGGGGGGSAPLGPTVELSGTIFFEEVPPNGAGGLDYPFAVDRPARGVTVEVVRGGAVVWTGQTDDNGNYSVQAPENSEVSVRIVAELLETGSPAWDVQIVDNTAGKAVYVVEGAPFDVEEVPVSVDLVAPSGWGGTSYTDERAAAPFAILDGIYDAIQTLTEVDPGVEITPLLINWSENNVPVDGNRAIGEIGTSFYTQNEIYLLGAEDVDTDEYDTHIVNHEFTHHLQRALSRNDSTGGQHTLSVQLDPRVAFGEGFANAFAAMSLDDPVLFDSMGGQQASGNRYNIETASAFQRGWFNEASVGSILYDVFDSNSDGADSLTMQFGPIYDVFVSDFQFQPAFTTIHAFLDELRNQNPTDAGAIDAIAASQLVNSSLTDAFGAGETNSAGSADALPIYTPVTLGGGPVTVCSTDEFGTFNRLSNRRFMRLTLTTGANVTITVDGPPGSDPDIVLWSGDFISIAESTTDGFESLSIGLTAGTFIIEVYEFGNLEPPGAGRICFDVEVF